MKRCSKWVRASVPVLLVFGISAGCASGPQQIRTVQLKVKGKPYETQMRYDRNVAATNASFYVNGQQLGQTEKFWPLASSHVYEGDVGGVVFKSMCTLDLSGNGWVQKVTCDLYANDEKKDTVAF